jgi:hypothetical protein
LEQLVWAIRRVLLDMGCAVPLAQSGP